ncbi:uncharacterized protein PRD47_004469 [Ara ararauna]
MRSQGPGWGGGRGDSSSPGGRQAGCQLPPPPLLLAYLGHFVCLWRACVPRVSPLPEPRQCPLGQGAAAPGAAARPWRWCGGQEKVKAGPPAVPAVSSQRGDAAARQGPAGEGGVRRTSLERSKNSAGEVIVLLLASPQLGGGQRPARGGSAGRAQEPKTNKTPAPAGERRKAEPSPFEGDAQEQGVAHPFFPLKSLSPGGRGLRPGPVLFRPGSSGSERRHRGGPAASTLPCLNRIRRPGEPPWFEGVFADYSLYVNNWIQSMNHLRPPSGFVFVLCFVSEGVGRESEETVPWLGAEYQFLARVHKH